VLKLLRSTCIPFRALPAPRRFLEEEEGAITAMTLILFLVMIVAAGVTWDMMRSEADRVHLQSTLDRAVIAAAPLDEERDAREVVESYLRAAGIDPGDVRIQTFDEPHATRVSARATSSVDSMFLRILGEDLVEVSVESEAREEKWHLEVSVVLDTSGSMRSNGKHEALQEAAIEFAQKVLETAEEEDVRSTISMVVYQDSVNLGSEVGSWFPMTTEHTHSNCAVFAPADYETVGIVAGTVLQRVGHFDRHERGRNYDGIVRQSMCPEGDKDGILPWSRDITEIESYVNSLEPADGTAINLGVKWGAALLDPTMRPHAQRLVDDGRLPSTYAGMPMDYEGTDTRKVLVVMTDGKNDEQRDLFADRKYGPSGVFVHRPDLEVPVKSVSATTDHNGDGVVDALDMPCTNGNGSVDGVVCTTDSTGAVVGMPSHGIDNINGRSNWSADWKDTRGRAQDWVAQGGTYTGYPWWTDADRRNWTEFEGTGTHNGTTVHTQFSIWSEERQQFWVKEVRSNRNQNSGGTWQDEPAGGTAAIELTFAEFYATVPVTFDNFWRGRGDKAAIDDATRDFYQSYAGEATMIDELDVYLQDICQAARNEGILVFTIAFQAPDWGQESMRRCAGLENPRHFFNVQDLDIGSAFDDVWGSIEKLKLTQ
jgi:Flp pilus assembly protein TadG